MTVQELKTAFVFAFKQEVDDIYFIPEFVNIFGEHIFEVDNFYMPSAFSSGIYLLLRKNNEKIFKFWSLNESEAINWKINEQIPKNMNLWIKYPIGIIKQFIEIGFEIDFGYDMLFWGNMPNGAVIPKMKGLELITIFALKDQTCKYQTSTLNQQINTNLISYINWNILPIELVSEITEALHEKIEGYKVVISNTHMPHKVDASSYYHRISECKLALEYLNKTKPFLYWDELTNDEFSSLVSTVKNPVAIKTVYHMISEIHRTKLAVKVIMEGNINTFGKLMTDSHASLRDNLEIVSPEVDAMVAEALKIEGVIGSRMAGCGFGGCTISLVKEEAINTFIDKVGKIYEEKTGIKNHFYIAEIGDYACKLYH